MRAIVTEGIGSDAHLMGSTIEFDAILKIGSFSVKSNNLLPLPNGFYHGYCYSNRLGCRVYVNNIKFKVKKKRNAI